MPENTDSRDITLARVKEAKRRIDRIIDASAVAEHRLDKIREILDKRDRPLTEDDRTLLESLANEIVKIADFVSGHARGFDKLMQEAIASFTEALGRAESAKSCVGTVIATGLVAGNWLDDIEEALEEDCDEEWLKDSLAFVASCAEEVRESARCFATLASQIISPTLEKADWRAA